MSQVTQPGSGRARVWYQVSAFGLYPLNHPPFVQSTNLSLCLHHLSLSHAIRIISPKACPEPSCSSPLKPAPHCSRYLVHTMVLATWPLWKPPVSPTLSLHPRPLPWLQCVLPRFCAYAQAVTHTRHAFPARPTQLAQFSVAPLNPPTPHTHTHTVPSASPPAPGLPFGIYLSPIHVPTCMPAPKSRAPPLVISLSLGQSWRPWG